MLSRYTKMKTKTLCGWLLLLVVCLGFTACSSDDETPTIPVVTISINVPHNVGNLQMTHFEGTMTNAHNGDRWVLPQPQKKDLNTFVITMTNQPVGHYDVYAKGTLSYTKEGNERTSDFEVTADHAVVSAGENEVKMVVMNL